MPDAPPEAGVAAGGTVSRTSAGTEVLKLSTGEKGLSEGTAEKIALGEHEMPRELADGIQVAGKLFPKPSSDERSFWKRLFG